MSFTALMQPHFRIRPKPGSGFSSTRVVVLLAFNVYFIYLFSLLNLITSEVQDILRLSCFQCFEMKGDYLHGRS